MGFVGLAFLSSIQIGWCFVMDGRLPSSPCVMTLVSKAKQNSEERKHADHWCSAYRMGLGWFFSLKKPYLHKYVYWGRDPWLKKRLEGTTWHRRSLRLWPTLKRKDAGNFEQVNKTNNITDLGFPETIWASVRSAERRALYACQRADQKPSQ